MEPMEKAEFIALLQEEFKPSSDFPLKDNDVDKLTAAWQKNKPKGKRTRNEVAPTTSNKKSKTQMQSWVQCEKCEKWRKVPHDEVPLEGSCQ